MNQPFWPASVRKPSLPCLGSPALAHFAEVLAQFSESNFAGGQRTMHYRFVAHFRAKKGSGPHRRPRAFQARSYAAYRSASSLKLVAGLASLETPASLPSELVWPFSSRDVTVKQTTTLLHPET